MSTVADIVRPIIEPVVEAEGYEFVDLEYVREAGDWYLRVYADKPEGISIDDCAHLSQIIGEKLDEMDKDPFADNYYLDISSPGAERPLRTAEEIEGAVGRHVCFNYYGHQHGETQHIGDLIDVTDNYYILQVQDKARLVELEIEKTAVSKARLAVKF